MITSRDIKFIFMGILIFLLSRYLYDRFFRTQRRPRRKHYRKRPRVAEPFNIKEKC